MALYFPADKKKEGIVSDSMIFDDLILVNMA